MATFNRFNCFLLDCGLKKHEFGVDQLAVALTDTAPVATDAVIGDITEISYTNLSSRNVTTTSWTQSSGVASLVCADLTLNASGVVAQWRYIVLYNVASGALIGWVDQAGEINMTNGTSHLINFAATALRLGV